MSSCSGGEWQQLRRSILLWGFAGTTVGAGFGALAGLVVALTVTFTSPGADTAAVLCGLMFYGALFGCVPGAVCGLVMGSLDPMLDRPGAREATAALVGLGAGVTTLFYYPPLMVVTGLMGLLGGWAAAALVRRMRR